MAAIENELTIGHRATSAITPLGLLQLALQKGGNIDIIERLATLQREEREYQAKVDFDDAKSRCQQKLSSVAQDMTRSDGRGKYASYEALNRAIRPVYVNEGFSVSFSEDESTDLEKVVMLGFLSRSGYERVYRKVLPIDSKGPKGNDVMTKTDAACSASSRAKRYVLKAMFNLAEGEDDRDGMEESVGLSDAVVAERLVMIENSKDEDELKKAYFEGVKMAAKVGDKDAEKLFMAAKDGRKKTLNASDLQYTK